MKKKVFFLMMVMIMTSQIVMAQVKGDKCAPLNQNRTLAEMGEFLMRDGVYFENLRASYAEAVSFSIDSTISSDKEGILWILRNTIFIDQDFIVPSHYENGVRYASKISFTNLTGNPSENWAAVQYHGEDHVYCKVSCMNPQKIRREYKKILTPKGTTPPPQDPISAPSGFKPAVTEECIIKNFTASPNVFRGKKGKLTLFWEIQNASFVNITNVGDNLIPNGKIDMDVFFGKRGDSISFTMNAFQDGNLCKSSTVYVWRKPMTNRLILKKIPDWVEGPIYALIIEETLRRWVIPAFSKNSVVQTEEEFHHVDANPQFELPKKGFNPNLTVAFHF